jgi:hypothetical protein
MTLLQGHAPPSKARSSIALEKLMNFELEGRKLPDEELIPTSSF